ncbi:MAG: hypothetical protein LKE53_06365 [Oscillospiraceae bacterium]|jgi:hypothetical protein|nr:hypothetical protein [Oscillospiraceae bacterium]
MEKLPGFTLKLAQQIAKKYFGTATGLQLDHNTKAAPPHYRRYKMQIRQLQVSICYTPTSSDYSPLARKYIQLRTYLSNGGVSTFGNNIEHNNIEQYINPITLEEAYDAEYDEWKFDSSLYDTGDL